MDKIILEAYCTYKIEKKIPRNKRSKWCLAKNKKKIPQYKCLKSNCSFFAYTHASDKDYKILSEVER